MAVFQNGPIANQQRSVDDFPLAIPIERYYIGPLHPGEEEYVYHLVGTNGSEGYYWWAHRDWRWPDDPSQRP